MMKKISTFILLFALLCGIGTEVAQAERQNANSTHAGVRFIDSNETEESTTEESKPEESKEEVRPTKPTTGQSGGEKDLSGGKKPGIPSLGEAASIGIVSLGLFLLAFVLLMSKKRKRNS